MIREKIDARISEPGGLVQVAKEARGLVLLMCDGPVKDSPTHQLEQRARLGDARSMRRLQELLERHPELREESRIQSLPSIIWASLYGWVALVDVLLSLRVDANVLDARGRNALHAACALGRLDVCHSLLCAGIDSRHADPRGVTAVMVAAQRGHVELVREVVRSDPSQVRLEDARGWTPLFYAVHSGAEGVLALLLECGADVGHVDAQGRTALHHARELHRHGCAQILQRARMVQSREVERRLVLLRCRFLAHAPAPCPPPAPGCLSTTCRGCLPFLLCRVFSHKKHKTVGRPSRPPASRSRSPSADPTAEEEEQCEAPVLAALSLSSSTTTTCSDSSTVGAASPQAVQSWGPAPPPSEAVAGAGLSGGVWPSFHFPRLLPLSHNQPSARRIRLRAARGEGRREEGKGKRETLAAVAWAVVRGFNADVFRELLAYMGP